MHPLSRFHRVLFLAGVATTLVACGGDDATGPDRSNVEIRVISGSAQFAEPRSVLEAPFEVQLRSVSNEQPKKDVQVQWSVTQGDGASLSRRTTTTDDAGIARTTLTLGAAVGLYRVEASVPGARDSPVEFWARAVGTPALTSVSESPVAPGDTVRLGGRNFIPEVDQMVVTFGGVRGPAVEGTETTLRARVPTCLPPGPVEVVVSLGDLRSEARSLQVEGDGPLLELAPGEFRTFDDPEAFSCARLPSSSSARYLADVHSTSTLGAATFDYGLVLRVGEEALLSATSAVAPAPPAGAEGPSPQARLKLRIRRLEREALAGALPGPRSARAPEPGRAPSPGDTRSFSVLNGEGEFQEVTAEVHHVGEKAVIYVDTIAPDGGFDSTDLAVIGGEFDDPIHPVVTDVFGEESDLDGNGRVVILFTPVVNEHTERGSEGFVGGFFFGVDLLEGREGSNGGEVFYALVPDPEGEFGDPRSRQRVLSTVPAILAHEFQHMVHFNQRVVVLGGETTDALWLSEALATTAEDLVARAYAARGREERSFAFLEGNYVRALRFLNVPRDVSLVVSAGQGSLEERGAGWLFLRYLEGRTGGTELLGDLTQTTATGVANVESRTGISWPDLVSEWSAALYLDGVDGLDVPPFLTFVGFDLEEELRRVDDGFSLDPPVLGSEDRLRVRSIRPSATDLLLLEPTGPFGAAFNLAGPGGSPPAPGAGLRLLLVRIR